MGPATLDDVTDRFSRNVGNYQSTLRNIPEERRSFTPQRKNAITKRKVFLGTCWPDNL